MVSLQLFKLREVALRLFEHTGEALTAEPTSG